MRTTPRRPARSLRPLCAAVVLVALALPAGCAIAERADGRLALGTAAARFPVDRRPLAEAGVEGSVLRLVAASGGDPDDEAAVDPLVARYRDGEGLAAVADDLAGARPFRDRYGGLDDPAFVDRLHRDVLGRAPTGEERTRWADRLAGGAGRGELLLALGESPEFVAATGTVAPAAPRPLLAPPDVEHSVARLHLGLTGSWPARDPFDADVRRYLEGVPLATIADGLLAEPAIAERWGGLDDEAFVTALLRGALGGEPAPADVRRWADRLAAGESRGAVVAGVTESAEAVAHTRTASPEPPPVPRTMLAVGDSVMRGAVDEIEAIPGWDTTVDARGCRQPTTRGDGCDAVDIPSGVDALRAGRAAGHLGGVVVIQLGNNGPMSVEEFDALMAEVADQRLVLALTLHEPRSFEAGNNEVIRDAPQRWPNLRVVDWHTAASSNPGWFSDGEGIHLSDAGAQAMADLIADHLPTS